MKGKDKASKKDRQGIAANNRLMFKHQHLLRGPFRKCGLQFTDNPFEVSKMVSAQYDYIPEQAFTSALTPQTKHLGSAAWCIVKTPQKNY